MHDLASIVPIGMRNSQADRRGIKLLPQLSRFDIDRCIIRCRRRQRRSGRRQAQHFADVAKHIERQTDRRRQCPRYASQDLPDKSSHGFPLFRFKERFHREHANDKRVAVRNLRNSSARTKSRPSAPALLLLNIMVDPGLNHDLPLREGRNRILFRSIRQLRKFPKAH